MKILIAIPLTVAATLWTLSAAYVVYIIVAVIKASITSRKNAAMSINGLRHRHINNKPAEKKTALVRGARATRGLGEPINAAAATTAHESGREQTTRPPRADQRERERETFRVLEAPSSQRGAKVERERKKAAEQAKKKEREEALMLRSLVIRADDSGGNGLGEAVVVAPTAAAAAEPAPAPRAGQPLGHAEASQLDHRVPTWPTLRDAGPAGDNPPAAGDSGARESVAVTSGMQPSASVHYAAPNGSVLDDAQEPIPKPYYDQLPPGFSEEQAEALWRKKGRPFCPRCHLRHPPPHDPELFEDGIRRFFADALDNSPAFREEVINRFPNIITLAQPAQLTLPSP
ncbi:hypothetical protein BFW01_g10671 [Lasiodiplodia theobromae]|uniref:Uncharacterized protein n=1 Tax=Lasiodiplodia theobromae TaxID=45133 RepID=A0A8H7MAE9_9PEZI|nr:hypothetical protein BFW01_g10671 [Lasiodiplodia theobromae]